MGFHIGLPLFLHLVPKKYNKTKYFLMTTLEDIAVTIPVYYVWVTWPLSA